jgi:alpha-D-xyloside xylohydrolase
MRFWCFIYGLRPGEWFRSMGKILAYGVSATLLTVLLGGVAMGQSSPLVLERDGRVISLVPYASNIVRVTMSLDKAAAAGDPGYGFVAKPSAEGWTHERNAEGYDVYRSARMVVRVAPGDLPKDKLPRPMPLDALNLELRQHYFGGDSGGNGPNDGGRGPHNDALLVTTTEGTTLLHMRTWEMRPESAEVAAKDKGTKGYRVAAMFDSPAGEHY